MLNIEGALYFCTFFLGIVNSLIVQPVVAAERTVFYRERAAHMYSVLPYVLSLVRHPQHHCIWVHQATRLVNALQEVRYLGRNLQ